MHHSNGYRELGGDENDAVEHAADRQLEDLEWRIQHQEVADFEAAREAVREWLLDETLVIGLSLSKKLGLLECFAHDYGLELGHVTIDTLRQRIEEHATLIVCYLGEARALGVLDDLIDFMETHAFTFEDIVPGNPHAWARHYAEREEAKGCLVFEYRNLEGEQLHADIYVYDASGRPIYFQRWLEKGSVPPDEESFDAS